MVFSPVHLQSPELPMHLYIGLCLPETAFMPKALSLGLSVGNGNQRKWLNVSETKLQF